MVSKEVVSKETVRDAKRTFVRVRPFYCASAFPIGNVYPRGDTPHPEIVHVAPGSRHRCEAGAIRVVSPTVRPERNPRVNVTYRLGALSIPHHGRRSRRTYRSLREELFFLAHHSKPRRLGKPSLPTVCQLIAQRGSVLREVRHSVGDGTSAQHCSAVSSLPAISA